MTRIFFVRHGQTQWNRERKFTGQADISLDTEGFAQAEQLGRRLRKVEFAAAYASDLVRTEQTAAPLLQGRSLQLVRDPRLREASMGVWEGLLYSEVAARYPEQIQQRMEHPASFTPPQGESLLAMQERVCASVHEMVARVPGENILVVSHGGPARAFLAQILQVPAAEFWRLQFENCAFAVVEFVEEQGILAQLEQLSPYPGR